MTRLRELEQVATDICPPCLADVDQTQAALIAGVREVSGLDVRSHREPVAAAFYVLYDSLRGIVDEDGMAGTDPRETVQEMLHLASDALRASILLQAP